MIPTDTSEFITDDSTMPQPVTLIAVSEGDNSRIDRMVRHGRWWAVKSKGRGIDSALFGLMLEKEFSLLMRLNHPSVVRATEMTFLPGVGKAMVMEWVEGEPIDKYLADKHPGRKARCALVGQLLEALAHIHGRGIVHRDIKPSNILVDASGRLFIIDFGLADDAASCMLKNVSGTPGHTAPEVVAGAESIDWRRADVYALGRIISLIGGYLPERLLARRCISVNPARRPASAGDALLLYKRLRKNLHMLATGAIVLICCAVLLLSFTLGRGESEATVSKNMTDDSVVEKVSVHHDTVTVKSPEAFQYTAKRKDSGVKSGSLENTDKTKGRAPDVIATIFVAMDRRDELSRKDDHGNVVYDRNALDSITASMLEIGKREGWDVRQCEIFSNAVHSAEFYAGKYPKIQMP